MSVSRRKRKEQSRLGGTRTEGELVALTPTNFPVALVAVAHGPSRKLDSMPPSLKSTSAPLAHWSRRMQCVPLVVYPPGQRVAEKRR